MHTSTCACRVQYMWLVYILSDSLAFAWWWYVIYMLCLLEGVPYTLTFHADVVYIGSLAGCGLMTPVCIK